MKKIIFNEPTDAINFEKLVGNEIIAYRCKNSNNIAVLCKLITYISPDSKINFGFVPFGETQGNPRFVGKTWQEAIKNASKERDVIVFNSMLELGNYIVNLNK